MSSQPGKRKTTNKGESDDSNEASVWRTALSISSGSHFGLAIQELVKRDRKESAIAPKFSSSGKAEQYEIPPDMEQLRVLLKGSVLVRNVRPMAC